MLPFLIHPVWGLAILAACLLARALGVNTRLLSLAAWLLWMAWLCAGPAAVWEPALTQAFRLPSRFPACLILTAPLALTLAWLRAQAMPQAPNMLGWVRMVRQLELNCGFVVAAVLQCALVNAPVATVGDWLLSLAAAASSWHFAEFAAGQAWTSRGFLQVMPLTDCALYERVQSLASKLGLPAQPVWRIPGFDQDRNAFGGASGVTVTDELVRALSRRELDVILLHELGHVRQRSTAGRDLDLLLRYYPLAVALLVVAPQMPLVMALLAWAVLLTVLWRRRIDEYWADEVALVHSQDAAAFITAKARLNPSISAETGWKLQLPDWFSTHPSPAARLRHAARRGGLSRAEVAALVNSVECDAPVGERYELPSLA